MAKVKFNVTVVGLEGIQDNLKNMVSNINLATTNAIAQRTEDLFQDVYNAISGGAKAKTAGATRFTGKQYAGTGLEMAKRGHPSVTVRTGRMRSLLTKSTFTSGNVLFGSVGWPSYIKPRARRWEKYRVEWPEKPIINGIIRTFARQRTGTISSYFDEPAVYIPPIILGTEKIYGRNVLRSALVNDINKQLTKNKIKNSIMEVLQE